MAVDFSRKRTQEEIEMDYRMIAQLPDGAARLEAIDHAYEFLDDLVERNRQTDQEQSRAGVEEVLAALMRPLLGLTTTFALSTEFGRQVGTEPERPEGDVYELFVDDSALSASFEDGRYADQLCAACLRIIAGKLLGMNPPGVTDKPTPEFIATMACLVARVEGMDVFVDRLQAFNLECWGMSCHDVMEAMAPAINGRMFGALEACSDWRLGMPGEFLQLYQERFDPQPEPAAVIATHVVSDADLFRSPAEVGGDAEWGIDE